MTMATRISFSIYIVCNWVLIHQAPASSLVNSYRNTLEEIFDMHFTRFAAVLLSASLAGAATIHRRIITADTIIQDVNNINAGVLANREATEAYQGGNLVTTLIQGTPV